jgi:hypothetical protein
MGRATDLQLALIITYLESTLYEAVVKFRAYQ